MCFDLSLPRFKIMYPINHWLINCDYLYYLLTVCTPLQHGAAGSLTRTQKDDCKNLNDNNKTYARPWERDFLCIKYFLAAPSARLNADWVCETMWHGSNDGSEKIDKGFVEIFPRHSFFALSLGLVAAENLQAVFLYEKRGKKNKVRCSNPPDIDFEELFYSWIWIEEKPSTIDTQWNRLDGKRRENLYLFC